MTYLSCIIHFYFLITLFYPAFLNSDNDFSLQNFFYNCIISTYAHPDANYKMFQNNMWIIQCVCWNSLTEPRVVCFYTNWSTYRGSLAVNPAAIDPNICTHLIYAFGSITRESTVIHSDEQKDIVEGRFRSRLVKYF